MTISFLIWLAKLKQLLRLVYIQLEYIKAAVVVTLSRILKGKPLVFSNQKMKSLTED